MHIIYHIHPNTTTWPICPKIELEQFANSPTMNLVFGGRLSRNESGTDSKFGPQTSCPDKNPYLKAVASNTGSQII